MPEKKPKNNEKITFQISRRSQTFNFGYVERSFALARVNDLANVEMIRRNEEESKTPKAIKCHSSK